MMSQLYWASHIWAVWVNNNGLEQDLDPKVSKPQTGFEPTASDLARIVIFRNSLILTKNIVKIVKLVCFKPKFVHITIIKC